MIRTNIRQMKHHLPNSEFKSELQILKQHNGRLQRLVTNCTASGFPAQGKQPISSPRLSPDFLKEKAAQAKDIYHAIGNSYTCQCPSPHEANLGLRQMSPKILDDEDRFELIFPIEEGKEDMIEMDLKSPTSTYSSIFSTGMASTESNDSFGMGYDVSGVMEDAILTNHTVIRTSVGRQEAASEIYHYHPSENQKAVHLLHGIEGAAQFRLAGAIMVRKMLHVSTTYAYSSKA